jgi:hypothetical protein
MTINFDFWEILTAVLVGLIVLSIIVAAVLSYISKDR